MAELSCLILSSENCRPTRIVFSSSASLSFSWQLASLVSKAAILACSSRIGSASVWGVSNEVSLKSSHAKAVFDNKFDEVDSSVVSVTSNSCTSSTVSWKILFAGGFLLSFSPVQLNWDGSAPYMSKKNWFVLFNTAIFTHTLDFISSENKIYCQTRFMTMVTKKANSHIFLISDSVLCKQKLTFL